MHIFVRTYHGRYFHAAYFLYSVADLADPGASLGQRAFLGFTNVAVNEANRLQSLLRLVFALAVHKLRGYLGPLAVRSRSASTYSGLWFSAQRFLTCSYATRCVRDPSIGRVRTVQYAYRKVRSGISFWSGRNPTSNQLSTTEHSA